MKKVIISVMVVLIVLGAFGVFFYLKAQESVQRMVLGVKNVKLQNVEVSQMPTEDVVGADILSLQRYPGSIRTAYTKKEIAETAIYQVQVPKEEVLAYFRTQILTAGWGQVNANDNKIIFIKEDNKLTVTAKTSSFGITTYQLILEKF